MMMSPSDDEVEIGLWAFIYGVTREEITVPLIDLDTEKFPIRANVFLTEVEAYRYAGIAGILSFSRIWLDGFGLWGISVAKDSGAV